MAAGITPRCHALPKDPAAVGVSGADCDSRFAAAGHLFVCKGAAFRPAYLTSALERGCVAYLCDEARSGELAQTAPGACGMVVEDGQLRRAMALASAEAWGHPDQGLSVVGVTGTKGKSTVAYMLRHILDAGSAAPRAGIMGSIETFDGMERAESVNTTPEAPDLWRHVANAREAGLSHLVMEVSSQALKYDRVVGLGLDVACFLNIGRDHISPAEHPDFEDYFESKLRIFDQARTAMVNLDSAHAERVLERASCCGRVLTHSSAGDARADVWATDVRPVEGGIRFVAHTPSWEGGLLLSMPGLFNVDNALSAIACCELLGIRSEQIREGLSKVKVPGRMELLPALAPKVVGIVDYAHNKLSYQRFFASITKEFPGRRIVAVFGAPGGKAHERRQELPAEASRWADWLIYTEEDPAHEDVGEICAQMAAATPASQNFEVIPDRPKAIKRAVDLALSCDEGAVVCLLAKGDETRQHEGDLFVPCETDGSIYERVLRGRLGLEDAPKPSGA